MLVVDEATEADVAELARLAEQALSEKYPVEWFLAHMDGGLTVAREVETDGVVGFAAIGKTGPCEAHLDAIAVDDLHRRQGVGSALLRTVQDDLCRHGAMRLSLEVREDDSFAKAFYTRHGFAPEGLMEHAYRDGSNAVRYTRPL